MSTRSVQNYFNFYNKNIICIHAAKHLPFICTSRWQRRRVVRFNDAVALHLGGSSTMLITVVFSFEDL